MTDLQRARLLGTSRRTAQRRRQALGIPPARKPSPVADSIVAALDFLGAARARDIADHLGAVGRIARVNLYSSIVRVAASGRILGLGGGRYSRLEAA